MSFFGVLSKSIIRHSFVRGDKKALFRIFQRSVVSQKPQEAVNEGVISSPAPFLHIPKGNFVDIVFQNSHKWSTKTALECSVTGRQISYCELEEQTAKWSGFLKQIGVSRGEIVTIIAPNCIQYGPLFLGTAAIGATLSPINWKSTADEIRRMVDITQSKILIFSRETERVVLDCFYGDPKQVKLFCIGKSVEIKTENVDDILEGRKGAPTSAPDKICGKETVYLPFSSGTTGPPKAVALSHNAFIASMHQYCNPFHDIMRETSGNFQEVTMAMLPFFHILGIGLIFSAGIYKGNKIVVMPQFDRESFLNTIISKKVSHLHTVPTLLHLLNMSPECNPENMSHINSIVCGAAPVSESAALCFKKKVNKNIDFFEVYGMTEVLATHHTSRKFPRLGTCGHLLSNVEAKVMDQDTGESLGAFERGEICIRTPSVMTEYVNNPTGTAEILRDGWAHTGDIGYYDNDGFFYIVDRTKDLIKVNGMQVSPSEIEEELQKHPSVQECSVVGVPDEAAGEVPKAFVVLKDEATEDELCKFLEKKLSKHKHLRGGVSFLQMLPKSETGKVLRRVLRDRQ